MNMAKPRLGQWKSVLPGVLGALAPCAAHQDLDVPPNILMILAEDHSAQLGCYGDAHARTPHIDRLASEGVLFQNAYVTQAGCSPSRASILTGLYPHQNGQIGLATHRMRMFYDELPNLPALLRDHGYTTGNIGKIHVNPESAFRFHYHENRGYNRFGNRDVEAVANEAGDFVKSTDGPFYLQVNFADAHEPFHPRQHGLPEEPFRGDEVAPLPFVGLKTPESLEHTANYYSCMARLDTGVGMLLDRLEQIGKLRNTLVIYLSDHGADMPRGKMTSYEGGVHVPLIFWMPGTLPSGERREQLVSAIDLMPTILEMAGVQVPGHLPGRSLLPVFEDNDAPWRPYLFTQFTMHWPENLFPQRTVRDERHKLIVNLFPDTENPVLSQQLNRRRGGMPVLGEDPLAGLGDQKRAAYALTKRPPRYQLYDLIEDPWEWNNLADDPEYAKERNRLSQVLKNWQEETNDMLRHPELLERLREEVKSTFIDGEYRHLRHRPEFEWRYVEYLRPD